MIYLVSPQAQEKEVQTLCFGTCAQILLGMVEAGEGLFFFPCRQADCPHEEMVSIGTHELASGDTARIRKLKTLAEPEGEPPARYYDPKRKRSMYVGYIAEGKFPVILWKHRDHPARFFHQHGVFNSEREAQDCLDALAAVRPHWRKENCDGKQ